MKGMDILSVTAGLCSIGGFAIALSSVLRSHRLSAVIGLVLLLGGAGVFAYLYAIKVPDTTISPALLVSLDSLQVADTGEVIEKLSPHKTTDVLSRAEHVKILVHGRVSGVAPSDLHKNHIAFAMVRPPADEEIWYVQKRERDTITPSGKFEVEAYLGGRGKYSAQHGQRFGLVVLVADFKTRDTYSNLSKVPKGRPMTAIHRLQVVREGN